MQEAGLACMQGMLLCLNRETRMAFILGEVFRVSGREGAEILEITPESFRQRLSLGRKQLRDFLDIVKQLVASENFRLLATRWFPAELAATAEADGNQPVPRLPFADGQDPAW